MSSQTPPLYDTPIAIRRFIQHRHPPAFKTPTPLFPPPSTILHITSITSPFFHIPIPCIHGVIDGSNMLWIGDSSAAILMADLPRRRSNAKIPAVIL